MAKPKIRFKGYTDDWEQRKFSEFVKNVAVRNKVGVELECYAVTNDRGFISQKEAHDDFGYMADIDTTAYNIVPPNSFVYNPARINVGSIGYYTGTENVIVSSLYEVFQTADYVDDRFMWHWFKSDHFPKWIERLQEGSVRLYFYYDKLMQCEMKMPSLEEQKKMGAFFDQLDRLITLHQRKCEETKKLKKYMLQKMFPQNGQTVPEIRFSGFTDAWEQRKFGSLLDETRNKTSVEDEDTLLSCAINGMYLNSELFSHFRGASNIGYLKVKKNDLILSAQNLHLGNCNVNLRFEHGIISPAYKVYELVDCNPLFIQAWVKRDSTKDFFLRASTEGASVCRKNIVWEELYKQELLVPNIEEQKKIGAYFDNIDHLITLHQCKCHLLHKLLHNDWEQRKLIDYLVVSSEKNRDNRFTKDDVLSVSGEYGIVNQIEFQGRSFAGASVSNYGVVENGDVVYTKSPLKSNPYGIIKTNKGIPGIVSTLYAVYKPKEITDSKFVQIYFELDSRMNSYMHPLVNKGAKNDMKVSAENALKGMVSFPKKDEQEMISLYFSTLDHFITLHHRKYIYILKSP